MDSAIGRARLSALLLECPACGRGAIRLFPVDGCKLACTSCAKPSAADLQAAYGTRP